MSKLLTVLSALSVLAIAFGLYPNNPCFDSSFKFARWLGSHWLHVQPWPTLANVSNCTSQVGCQVPIDFLRTRKPATLTRPPSLTVCFPH